MECMWNRKNDHKRDSVVWVVIRKKENVFGKDDHHSNETESNRIERRIQLQEVAHSASAVIYFLKDSCLDRRYEKTIPLLPKTKDITSSFSLIWIRFKLHSRKQKPIGSSSFYFVLSCRVICFFSILFCAIVECPFSLFFVLTILIIVYKQRVSYIIIPTWIVMLLLLFVVVAMVCYSQPRFQTDRQQSSNKNNNNSKISSN